jgi:hypothetical protein
VDFLLFNQMDKQPVLAIEVDGTGFHEARSKQAGRDKKLHSGEVRCSVPAPPYRRQWRKRKNPDCTKGRLIMPKIIRNAIRCKKLETLLKARLSMISSFAAAVRAPWTVALIIFVGAETLEIGKNCPKWKRWKTTAH